MLKKIDHLGIAVRSLEEGLALYRDILGLEVKGIEEVPAQKVRVAFLPVGETKVELLESTDPDGPIAKFIVSKGPGLQHVAFRVENLEQTLAELKAQGVPLIDETPRQGAGGARIAFLHPKGTQGLLIELCERQEGK